MEMLAPITWPSSSSSEEEDEMDQGASPRPRGGGGGRRMSIVISFGGHSELIPLLRAPQHSRHTHEFVQRAVLSDVAGAEKDEDEFNAGNPSFDSAGSSAEEASEDSSEEEADDRRSPQNAEADQQLEDGLAELKQQYDREVLQSSTSPSGPLFRRGRRAAISIDTSEPIRPQARDKVRQAIFTSLGPDSEVGAEMIQQLDLVNTVQELRSFIGRNAHNLSELGQIQVEMQMSALGAWKRGFKALRGAMMFGKLKQGEDVFDESGEKKSEQQLAAEAAEAAARREKDEAERMERMAAAEEEERARREREGREAELQLLREAEEAAAEEAARLAAEKRNAEQEEEEARRRRAEAEGEAALKAAEEERQRQEAERQAQARREAKATAAAAAAASAAGGGAAGGAAARVTRAPGVPAGATPLRSPRTPRSRRGPRSEIKPTDFNDMTGLFAGLGISGDLRPSSSQLRKVSGGAARTFSRGSPRAERGLLDGAPSPQAGPDLRCPDAGQRTQRRGPVGALPSISMQRLATNLYREEPVRRSPKPTAHPGPT